MASALASALISLDDESWYENVSQINPFLPNFILVIVIYHIGQIYFLFLSKLHIQSFML